MELYTEIERICRSEAPREQSRRMHCLHAHQPRPCVVARSSYEASPTARHPRDAPARTCTDAVRLGRAAIRSMREARADILASRPAVPAPSPSDDPVQRLLVQAQQSIWASVELPLPVRSSLLTSTGVRGEPDQVRINDEGDFPGGQQQRFRVLRPLVEGMLDGYGCKFLGLLESDADGVGLWSSADMTVVAGVTNATVPSLLKLLEGGYGARVQQPGHVVLAVNGAWTGDARDVGQPWDRALKAKASAVLSPEAPPSGDSSSRSLQPAPSSSPQHSAGLTLSRWEHLYLCRVLRTSKGGLGLLHRAWPGPFEVYALPLDDARELGPLVLSAPRLPSPQDVAAALQGTREAMAEWSERLKKEEEQRYGGGLFGGPWPPWGR